MSAPAPDARLAAELERQVAALAAHGADGAGVTRLAYDAAWCAAQRWLAAEAAARGLVATPDSAGNLFFHAEAIPAGEGSPPAIFVGSHLDTVRRGGRYDGAFGVLAALHLARGPAAAGEPAVVGFVSAEEEESRFRGGLMGARSLLGLVERAELDAVRDDAGTSWGDALAKARARGCAAPPAADGAPFRPPFRPAAEIELHIEQGPVLEAAGESLGIVTGIAGYARLRARLRGEARHAGTTPMEHRRDALAAAAECVLAAEALARDRRPPAVATAGRIEASPGLFNVVPGECELWLEARHADGAALARLEAELETRCRAIASRRGIALGWSPVSRQEPVTLSPELAARAEELARELGIPHRRMVSGAGHDSMVFARAGVPALMIFVPSRGGVSHAPEEFTGPASLALGVEFARELCARLAAELRA